MRTVSNLYSLGEAVPKITIQKIDFYKIIPAKASFYGETVSKIPG